LKKKLIDNQHITKVSPNMG